MGDGTVSAKVDLGDLEERLGTVAPKLARATVRKALKEGAEIVRSAIEQAAESKHNLTGFMAGHIVISPARTRGGDDGSSITYSIGPQKDAGYFVNPTRHEGKLTFKGKEHYAALAAFFAELGSKHQAPDPFMGPAAEAVADQVVELVAAQIGEMLGDLGK